MNILAFLRKLTKPFLMEIDTHLSFIRLSNKSLSSQLLFSMSKRTRNPPLAKSLFFEIFANFSFILMTLLIVFDI